jgi:hypothetical protein
VSGAASKRAVCVTVTGTTSAYGCVVQDTTTLSQTTGANPSVTMSVGGVNCQSYGVLFSGQDAVASVTPGAGVTEILEYDAGAEVANYVRLTTPTTADHSLPWTVATEDAVILGVALAETAPVYAVEPMRKAMQFQLSLHGGSLLLKSDGVQAFKVRP